MSAVLAVPCPHCGAAPGHPCRSVGRLPIVEPHMRRLDGVARSDDEYREARDDYAHAVVVHFFGYATPGLIERARKDRSLNDRKPWVRCALERARFS